MPWTSRLPHTFSTGKFPRSILPPKSFSEEKKITVFHDMDNTWIRTPPVYKRVNNAVLEMHGAEPLTAEELSTCKSAFDVVDLRFKHNPVKREQALQDYDRLMHLYIQEELTKESGGKLFFRGSGFVIPMLSKFPHIAQVIITDNQKQIIQPIAEYLSPYLAGATTEAKKPDPTPVKDWKAYLGAEKTVKIGDSLVDVWLSRNANIDLMILRDPNGKLVKEAMSIRPDIVVISDNHQIMLVMEYYEKGYSPKDIQERTAHWRTEGKSKKNMQQEGQLVTEIERQVTGYTKRLEHSRSTSEIGGNLSFR